MSEQVDLILHNIQYVVVVDEKYSVLKNVSIAIKNGKIHEIVPIDQENKWSSTKSIDCSHHLVMPGLINTHTHTPMTLLRGVAEDVDLQGFLEKVWAEEARIMNEKGTYFGARLGGLEALLGGTTCTLDMYLHPHMAHKGAVEVGLRHLIGPVFFDFAGPDGLEWDKRIEYLRNWPKVIKEIGGPYVPLVAQPHSTYTVSPENLAQVAQISKEIGAIFNTHISENLQENEDVQTRYQKTPTKVLADVDALSNAVFAHAVKLTDDDRQIISDNKVSLSHCPGSNLKLASGAFEWVKAKEKGINVSLGTDGCSSSNDLDMFNVMRQAANLAKLISNDPAAVSVAEVVRAATYAGAKALGLADRIGSIEVGKEADLIVLDLDQPHLVPVGDPHALIVYAAGRSDVVHVLVAGDPVIVDRLATKVDISQVIADARKHISS
jgi:5-methylthioadenosine/S-adenosylhomocysteine deaminase